jgi:hypothetical protein
VRFADYSIAYLPADYLAAHGSNFSAELVTQDDRRPIGKFVMVNMKIGPTHAARLDRDEHI